MFLVQEPALNVGPTVIRFFVRYYAVYLFNRIVSIKHSEYVNNCAVLRHISARLTVVTLQKVYIRNFEFIFSPDLVKSNNILLKLK